jgi:hypothetical protein
VFVKAKGVVTTFEIPSPNLFTHRSLGTGHAFGHLEETEVDGKMFLYMVAVNEVGMFYGLCIGFRTEAKKPTEGPGRTINVLLPHQSHWSLLSGIVAERLAKWNIHHVTFYE